MAFRGKVLSVGELLEAASVVSESVSGVGVLHTASGNAVICQELLADGESLDDCWRFGILQTLDDYTSTLRRGGPSLAAGVFTESPQKTGSVEIDAAFAALADYLSGRDGWLCPKWADDPTRKTKAWYPSVPVIFREDAKKESPPAFRERGIFITQRSLARA